MNKKQLQTSLSNIGLECNSAIVYGYLLQAGPTAESRLEVATNLKKNVIKEIIEDLKKLGLVRIDLSGKESLIAPENPERLESVIENKRKGLASDLPNLLHLFNQKNSESSIRVYEGLSAVESAYEELLRDLTPNDYYLAIGSDANEWMNLDQKFFAKFLEKRSRLQIPCKLLLKNTLQNNNFKKQKSHFYQQIKILKETNVIATSVEITPKKVLLFNIAEPMTATLICNENMAKTIKDMFDVIWESTQEVK